MNTPESEQPESRTSNIAKKPGFFKRHENKLALAAAFSLVIISAAGVLTISAIVFPPIIAIGVAIAILTPALYFTVTEFFYLDD